MSRLYLWMALGVAVAATGCAELQDLAISSRNRNAAYSAWKAARWDYWRQGVPYRTREHISRGFRQGYFDVAAGGSGKLPMFPPSSYWGVRYQNPAGNELVAAWFRGYRDGVMAAERDGVGYFNQIPSSSAPPQANPYASGPIGPWNLDNLENVPAPPPGEPVMPVPPTLEAPNTVRSPTLQEDVPLKTLDLPATTPSAIPLPVPAPKVDAPANGATSGAAGAPKITVPQATPPAATAPTLNNAAPPKPAATGTSAPKVDTPEPAKPAPASGPSSEPAKPRDPIGGKQTSVEREELNPVARQALFGGAIR